ncbi:MAG: hypothetical protein V4642_03610 [Bacteroidota bacterium]
MTYTHLADMQFRLRLFGDRNPLCHFIQFRPLPKDSTIIVPS